MAPALDIRIGTLVGGNGDDPAGYIRQIIPHGFESFSITFWQHIGGKDLAHMAAQVKDAIGDRDIKISTLGIFGNPLETSALDVETLRGWEMLIDSAHLFGTDIVSGFTGRLRDKSIDESLPRYKEVFAELGKRAADRGVKIAFENCWMDGDWNRGDWNIAHSPDAWAKMFDVLPAENIGLEWEPCHQMVALIDPMPQIRDWIGKIFHVHGKDATVLWDIVRKHGVRGKEAYALHRTPGFGDSNWTDIISELRRGGYTGSIDIEGWHDPVYKGDLEMTGQVHGLNYLKACRTTFVPNPV